MSDLESTHNVLLRFAEVLHADSYPQANDTLLLQVARGEKMISLNVTRTEVEAIATLLMGRAR